MLTHSFVRCRMFSFPPFLCSWKSSWILAELGFLNGSAFAVILGEKSSI